MRVVQQRYDARSNSRGCSGTGPEWFNPFKTYTPISPARSRISASASTFAGTA